ncbi:MAG: hypothetical protein EPO02_10680 [Nitrospirae bacterium]|nr:MAG: hypothetical protein EPO02_10680 [Nitrospirota bacterium]
MRLRLLVGLILLLNGLAGCQYYQEYRNTKGEADIKEEKAELLKAHRLCLQKYEGDPAGQKERCAPYAQAIQDFDRRSPAGK